MTNIRPFFINGTLTRPLYDYLEPLEETVTPVIVATIEDDDIGYGSVFQQDKEPRTSINP